MQKIIERNGTEQPEPGDSGFDQITGPARFEDPTRIERILAAAPTTLAELGTLTVAESSRADNALRFYTGEKAIALVLS